MDNLEKAFENVMELGQESLNEKDWFTSERLWKICYFLAPKHPHVNSVLGHIYLETGHLQNAIQHLERACEVEPDNHKYLGNLGAAYLQAGDMERAKGTLEDCLKLVPDYSTCLNNLGHIHRSNHDHDEALACYLEAYDKNPDNPAYLSNLANAYSAMGQLEKAEEVLLEGIERFPEYPEFHNNLGNVYNKYGRPKDAMAEYQKMLDVRPNISAAANKVLVNLYSTDVEPIKQRYLAQDAMKVMDEVERLDVPQYNHDKPRIGFISAHFGMHPVGYFSTGLFKGNTELEYYVYSKRIGSDKITEEIKASTNFRKITGLNEKQVCDLIQQDEIDILVDMGGLSGNNVIKIMKMKPAPIQIGWVGFAGTRGVDEIDYLISDWIHSPEGTEEHFTESLIRMPNDYICYYPAHDVEIHREKGPVTFIAAHNSCKMNEKVLSLWGRIIQAVPDSRILMAYKGLTSKTNQERIKGILGSYGVEENRIEIHDHITNEQMLQMYNRADIMLDTWPYSSGLVCIESLYMGVPVIALPSEMYSGRHSWSHLKNVGLEEYVCHSEREYIEKAINLAKRAPINDTMRKQVRDMLENSPIMCYTQFSRDFNSKMVEVYSA